MLLDRVSNPGPLTYESGALPIAVRGPAFANFGTNIKDHQMLCRGKELISCNCCNYMLLTHGPSQAQHNLWQNSCCI